jgi:hypothetical protein
MSGIQSPEPPPPDAVFPAVGQYDYVPGPGDEGYVEPETDDDPEADAEIEDIDGDLDDEG